MSAALWLKIVINGSLLWCLSMAKYHQHVIIARRARCRCLPLWRQ
jgi:hypothetical protein